MFNLGLEFAIGRANLLTCIVFALDKSGFDASHNGAMRVGRGHDYRISFLVVLLI